MAIQRSDLGVKECNGLPIDLASELLHACALMPLMFVNFRMSCSPQVVATDASEQGLGVCHSVGITQLGRAKLDALTNSRELDKVTGVGLIELWGGIGGARAAINNLGIEPEITVSMEMNLSAIRVTQAA